MVLVMFSNFAKKNFSIANKFTILYTSASMLILIIIALALSWALSDLMQAAERQYLIDEVYVVKNLLYKHNENLSSIKQEVDGVPEAQKNNASYYYFSKVKDSNGKVLMSTPGAEQKISHVPFPALSKTKWQDNIATWHAPNGESYLLINAPILYDQAGNIKLSMEVALNTDYPQSLIIKYQIYIGIFLLLLFGLLLILGKFIAKSSLKRLYEMAEITQQITASKLSERIDHQEWPKELISLGRAFNEMLAGIEKAFNNLSQCTNELSHELRMPINNLIGSTEIILSKPRDTSQYQQLIESNLEEFRRLSKLSDSILFLARNEFPNTVVPKTTIQLEEEVFKISEFYRDLAADKNITIDQTGSAIVQANQLLIQRAITNLLSNAIKYSNENSNILFEITKSQNCTELAIQDNGIGIETKHIDKVFDRFYRADDSQASNSWGLGLAIVKMIMDLHKGSVSVESDLGKGSRFVLSFP